MAHAHARTNCLDSVYFYCIGFRTKVVGPPYPPTLHTGSTLCDSTTIPDIYFGWFNSYIMTTNMVSQFRSNRTKKLNHLQYNQKSRNLLFQSFSFFNEITQPFLAKSQVGRDQMRKRYNSAVMKTNFASWKQCCEFGLLPYNISKVII